MVRIVPLAVEASWPAPNYVDPVTRGPAFIYVNAIFMFLITVAVLLRYYSRLSCRRWFGLDDLFIGIALIFSLGLGITVLIAFMDYGWDRHLWDLRLTQLEPASILAFVAKLLYSLSATFIRISLICFLQRLIRDSGHKKFISILRLAIAWQIAVCILFVTLSTFTCIPVQAYWAIPIIKDAKCLDEGTVTLYAGVINSVSDLMVTLLPIPIVMKLNMPLPQRIGVTSLLSLGLVVTAAGVCRTYFIWKSLVSSYDETWYCFQLWLSSLIEIDLGVLCACAPALKPLFARFVSHASSYISSMSGSTHSNTASPTSSFSGGKPRARLQRTSYLKTPPTPASTRISDKSTVDATTTPLPPNRTSSNGSSSSDRAIWLDGLRKDRNAIEGKRRSWFGLRSHISCGTEDADLEEGMGGEQKNMMEMKPTSSESIRQGIEVSKTVNVSVTARDDEN